MKTLLTLVLLVSALITHAQKKVPLETGKPLPEWFQPYTAQYKGMPVVIDLFSSYCVVCFQMMPKVDSLQKLYQGKVKILVIGKEDPKIRPLYARVQKMMNLSLDVHIDSIIFKRNAIAALPKYLWITADGILDAITGIEGFNHETLEQFSITGKWKDLTSPKVNLYQSSLTTFNAGEAINLIPAGIDPVQHDTSFLAQGVTLPILYRYAYFGRSRWDYGDSLYSRVARDIVVVGEDAKLSVLSDSALYTYQTFYKPGEYGIVRPQLKSLLSILFNYDVVERTTLKPAWKITINPASVRNLTERKAKSQDLSNITGLWFINQPVSALWKRLNYYDYDLPVLIDQTGLSTITVDLDAMMTNTQSVRAALQQKGFVIQDILSPIVELVLIEKTKKIAAN